MTASVQFAYCCNSQTRARLQTSASANICTSVCLRIYSISLQLLYIITPFHISNNLNYKSYLLHIHYVYLYGFYSSSVTVRYSISFFLDFRNLNLKGYIYIYNIYIIYIDINVYSHLRGAKPYIARKKTDTVTNCNASCVNLSVRTGTLGRRRVMENQWGEGMFCSVQREHKKVREGLAGFSRNAYL